MINLLKGYWKWFFSFLISFLVQILIITILYKIHTHHVSSHHQSLSYRKLVNDFSDDQINEFKQLINETDLNDVVLNCDTDDSFLKSAIERARTQLCKIQIKKVFCLHQANQLYPITIANHLNRCTIKNLFKHSGCYLNNRRPSIIESLVFKYKKANELKCSYLCTQLNRKYFGIENSTLCHCLQELPSKQLLIDSTLCNMFCDQKTESFRCGSEYLISIYETGVNQDDREINDNQQIDPIKIAFLFSVNNRSIRQIKRLIKQLYDRRHIYFIHVDKQNDFLYNYLRDEAEGKSNLIVTNQRFYTIWGGTHLLQMLLNSFKILLNHTEQWDYVINLSESDYPIKSLASLENYLYQFKGKNFLKFHGQTDDAFLRKQGLKVLFLQCENKMWRINAERNLIKEIKFTGGSDWFALHRSFVHFIINESNDQFLRILKQFFNHTLLPAESFFHTVLANSGFCTKLINNNLHITNWKRKIGCKCQYRHIVDWCGCSPNVFKRQDDWFKLKSTLNEPLFFARKFDPLIDHEILNQIELTYNPSSSSQINLNKYWHNEYHYKYDRSSSSSSALSFIQRTYSILSTLALNELFSYCPINYELIKLNSKDILDTISLSNVHTFINQVKYVGKQISFNFTYADRFELTHLKLESLISSNHHFKLYNDIESLPFELILLKVCTEYDVKEDLFRNFGCLMNNESELTVRYKWKYTRQQTINECQCNSRSSQNYTINFIWIHPSKQITLDKETINLSSNTSNLSIADINKLNTHHFKAQLNRPIEPGIWKLLLVSEFNEKLDKNSNQKIDSQNLMKFSNFNDIELSKSSVSINWKDKLNGVLDKLIRNIKEARLQSRVIAETKFLVFESNENSVNSNIRSKFDYSKIIEQVKLFWSIKDICLDRRENVSSRLNQCRFTIKNCLDTTWSSVLPDPKSELIS